MFGKYCRELLESLLELTVLFCVKFVLVVRHLQLEVLNLYSEFLLVDIGCSLDTESHILYREGSLSPLFNNIA